MQIDNYALIGGNKYGAVNDAIRKHLSGVREVGNGCYAGPGQSDVIVEEEYSKRHHVTVTTVMVNHCNGNLNGIHDLLLGHGLKPVDCPPDSDNLDDWIDTYQQEKI